MSYVSDRIVHDADSHVMETPGWYDPWVDPAIAERVADLVGRPSPKIVSYVDAALERQRDPEARARAAEEIMLRKGIDAHGAFDRADRPAALDALGFSSQLVFTTSLLGPLHIAERKDGGDLELAYGLARAHNHAIVDFCSVDRRLLPVAYLPLMDIDTSVAFVEEAIEGGAAGLMIASTCPKAHGPSHVGLDAVWARAQEAGVPILLHVGGGAPMDPGYKANGLPPVKDFAGGDANFTSVSFMPIAYSPMQTLATMIIDGVLDRFPGLRFGVIEQGASWVPGWMRSMDAAAEAFQKNETRLKELSMRPSDFVRRQVRVTPYPHEPVGWVIKNTGPDVCMFSSDFPHIEGGRHPRKRFEASMDAEGCTEDEREGFYRRNFEDLMRDRVTSLV
jgi:predicted TIM-barrel fold metal-dependent hydrolase